MMTNGQGIKDKLTGKDFATDQDVRWCPGCGDYSILKQIQTVMADTGLTKEQVVFISGIGCAARFPYYMDTYGMHSIHGRAPAIATGLKSVNPELSVWVATGDGDSLSIGGNHLIHVLRRNPDINILLFNNEIYGLTKGQYSPTSPIGAVTKSTPMGSLDSPFNPLNLSLGAGATFIARSMDRDPKHLREITLRGHEHKGTSLIEIYQNCNVFNDGAFSTYTDKTSRKQSSIYLHHGEPLIFGPEDNFGIRLDGHIPKVVDMTNHPSKDDLWIHDEQDRIKAGILAQFSDMKDQELPQPFGVLYSENRETYEDLLVAQIEQSTQSKSGDLDGLLQGPNTWVIQ